jgi:glycosyltransferase involved in cell wall biosynthesis
MPVERAEKLIVAAACGEMNARPFLRKLAVVLAATTKEYEFWGWARAEQAHSPGPHAIRILVKGGGEATRTLWWRYLLWMVRLFATAVTHPGRATWMCCDLDAAFPIYLASRVRRRTSVLFFNLDNFALRYRWPFALRWLIGSIERHVGNNATLHIVPGMSRWSSGNRNLRIVSNTPTANQIARARAEVITKRLRRSDDTFVIYVNGWLTETRGLQMIFEAAQALEHERFRFILAGRCLCPAANALANLGNVEYLGELSTEASLATYARTHLCLTLYDPAIPINRVAEPNKWHDCVLFGVPFIANNGIETAAPFVDAGACRLVTYGDATGLTNVLRALAARPDEWLEMRDAIAAMNAVPWDVQVTAILQEAQVVAAVVDPAGLPVPGQA